MLFSDDLFIFDTNLISHKFVERPALTINIPASSKQNIYDIDIWAVSTEWSITESCVIDINAVIIENMDDQGIYNTSMDEGPDTAYDVMSDLSNQFPLDNEYIGPNIGYIGRTIGPGAEDEIDMFAEFPRQVSYIEIENKNWSQVIVAKVEHKNENEFYAFFQFQDFKVTIYDCSVDDDNDTSIKCLYPHTV